MFSKKINTLGLLLLILILSVMSFFLGAYFSNKVFRFLPIPITDETFLEELSSRNSPDSYQMYLVYSGKLKDMSDSEITIISDKTGKEVDAKLTPSQKKLLFLYKQPYFGISPVPAVQDDFVKGSKVVLNVSLDVLTHRVTKIGLIRQTY